MGCSGPPPAGTLRGARCIPLSAWVEDPAFGSLSPYTVSCRQGRGVPGRGKKRRSLTCCRKKMGVGPVSTPCVKCVHADHIVLWLPRACACVRFVLYLS